MKTLLIALLVTSTVVGLFAQKPEPSSGKRLKLTLIRNLSEATDIAVVERLESGAYRVLRVLRGGSFVPKTTVNLKESIWPHMRQEPRLVVWEKNYVGDFTGHLLMAFSVEAIPLSEADDVVLEQKFRFPLKELVLENSKGVQ